MGGLKAILRIAYPNQKFLKMLELVNFVKHFLNDLETVWISDSIQKTEKFVFLDNFVSDVCLKRLTSYVS